MDKLKKHTLNNDQGWFIKKRLEKIQSRKTRLWMKVDRNDFLNVEVKICKSVVWEVGVEKGQPAIFDRIFFK